MTTSSTPDRIEYTTPGMDESDAYQIVETLQDRLHTCNGLQLTLKHVHWNVVGPQFISVHKMIDPQVEDVRAMADELAERITTLGGSPQGTPMTLARELDQDYHIGRALVEDHLVALDRYYRTVVERYRASIEQVGKFDPVTQDILIKHTQQLELFHWFVRAHLEDPSGQLRTDKK